MNQTQCGFSSLPLGSPRSMCWFLALKMHLWSRGGKKKDVQLILHSASREETAVAALNQAQVS